MTWSETLFMWFLLALAYYLALVAYPGMFIVFMAGKLMGFTDIGVWEFTKMWFSLRWIGNQ